MKYSKMMECISKLTAKKNLKLDGVAVSSVMQSEVELWDLMYRDRAPWVDNKKVFSAGIAAAVSAEIARLVTLEMKSEVTGSNRANYINEVYQGALSGIREQVEYGCAKGSLVFKPYLAGKKVVVQFCQADSFFPIAFDSNKNILQCAFTEQICKGKEIYTRIELHSLESGRVVVRNYAYLSRTGGTIGTEIPLESVEQWKDIEAEAALEGTDKLLIGVFKVPLANTVDMDSPLGVSVFSRAVPRIKMADKRYSQIDWEYDSKETAIHLASSLLKYNRDTDKFEYPAGRERLYRTVEYNAGATDKPFMEPFSPDIRDEAYYHGFNQLLRRIEFDCCLAYGTLSDAQDVDKTAEEIRSSKQRSYAAISDTQQALQRALTDLVDAIDYWVSIGNLAPEGEYKASFDWDDSIITDNDIEMEKDFKMLSAGIIRPEEFRSKWMGEDLETAKKNLPYEAEVMQDRINIGTLQSQSQEVAPEVQGKTLNGAQTQSLIAIMAQFSAGELSEGQAINLISTAIGIDKEEARRILNGEV